MNLRTLGPAPADQQGRLPGQYDFNLVIGAQIQDVFDGVTLQQSALEAGIPLPPNGFFQHSVVDTMTQERLALLNGRSTGTSLLKP